MARLNEAKAGKDYPKYDIKKGDTYWWTQEFRGPKRYFKTRPKPSQYASGDFMPTWLSVGEELAMAQADGLEDAVSTAVSQLEELRDSTQEKFDNMPEGLQQGDTGQLLEGRVNACDEWIDALQEVDLEDRDPDVSEADWLVSKLEELTSSEPDLP